MTARDRRGRSLRLHRRPARQAQGRALAPEAHHRRDRGDDRRRQAAHREVPRRGEGRGRRGLDRRARAAHQEGGGRDAHPHRGGAPRARHAGRHAQGRAEPARRGRSAFGSGQLIVWGSAPKDTRVNVDGVEIPALYHVGGLRSTVNSDLVRSIDLSPGRTAPSTAAASAAWSASSSRSLPKAGVHGYVAADVIDASALVSAAVTPRLRLGVAGRVSYLDRLLPTVTSADVGDFVPIPRYDDYQARATLSLRQDEEIAADLPRVRRSPAPRDPVGRPAEVRSQNTDTVLQARLRPLHAPAARRRQRRRDALDRLRHHASTNRCSARTPITSAASTWQYALRASYRRKLATATTLSVGLDMQARTSTSTRRRLAQPCRRARATSSCSASRRATTSTPTTGPS